jgi:hypothetical protein
VKVTNTRQTRGVIIWRERGGDDSVVSIACFRANDYSQADPTRANGQATSALEQAEEIAAEADLQYEPADPDAAAVETEDIAPGDGDIPLNGSTNGQASLFPLGSDEDEASDDDEDPDETDEDEYDPEQG